MKLPKLTNLTVLLAAGEAGKRVAPTEFLIWAYGTVETTKGTFLFTREDAEGVIRRALDKGHDLGFDYDHQTFFTEWNGQPAISAGWFTLEAREDGLYAVGISWTDKARAHLEAGEYRYFSPAFDVTEDGHIVELYNIALTNLPATKHIESLVAASQKGANGVQEEKPVMEKHLLILLGLAAGASEGDATARIQGLRAVEAELLTLTGAQTVEAARGVIAGWKQAAAQVPTLTAELTALQNEQREAKLTALIEQGVREGKITPAQKDTFKTCTVDFLTSFLASAPVIVTAQSRENPEVTDLNTVVLTAEEKDLCRRMNLKEEDYIANKKRYVAAQGGN